MKKVNWFDAFSSISAISAIAILIWMAGYDSGYRNGETNTLGYHPACHH